MSENAILLVADDNYLPHAKHVMVNCRRQGCWDGEFALIVPEGTDTSTVDGRGIEVISVPSKGFLAKFYIFSEQLRKWPVVIYLDCDVIVLSDLHPLLEQLAAYEPLEEGRIIADLQDDPAWMVFERAAHGSKERDEMFMQLVQEFPCVLTKFWNTAMLVFDPRTFPTGTVGMLQGLQEQYALINNPEEEGTDQQIIHIGLYPRFRKVKEKAFCFWGLDELNARVPCEGRGWHGNEVPIVLHYGRWYAPWIEKTPEMDAYQTDRLGRVCRELYAENVAAFEQEFPR